MRVQTDAPQHVLQAQPTGDRLRVARGMHPQSSRLDRIADAEAAVAESANVLYAAAQIHHRKLTRLAVLRQRAGLPAQPVPAVDILATPDVPFGWFAGRIVERQPLTQDSKTFGKLETASGHVLEWIAGSFYVDMLEPLFTGVPVIVTGVFRNETFSIQEIKAAPATYWTPGERDSYTALSRLGGSTVTRASNVRAELMTQHQALCQDCGGQLTKPSKASLIQHADGYRLVCRPCKQVWIDAGRPVAAKAGV